MEGCFEKEIVILEIKDLELILSQYDKYFKRKLLDISNISGGVFLLITGPTTEIPRLLLLIGLLPLFVFFTIHKGTNLIGDFKDKFSTKSLFREIVASNIPEVRYDSIFAIKDTFDIHSNRYLLYYDFSWRVWFFSLVEKFRLQRDKKAYFFCPTNTRKKASR